MRLEELNELIKSYDADDHGYRFHWTGWKEGQDNDTLVAQWLAWEIGGEGDRAKRFYASTPGGAGRYERGDIFDLSCPGLSARGLSYLSRFDLMWHVKEEILEKAQALKDDAFRRLRGAMEAEGETV